MNSTTVGDLLDRIAEAMNTLELNGHRDKADQPRDCIQTRYGDVAYQGGGWSVQYYSEESARQASETPVMPADAFAHPIDEPCPSGCPTRLAEIAASMTGHLGADSLGRPLTAEDVQRALDTPAEQRDSVSRMITDMAENWV